jgi:hypothetical protein
MYLKTINARLRWQYANVCNNPMGLEQIRTTCIIEEEGKTPISAESTTYSGDSFLKSEGRRRTLTKCISMYPREVRARIWHEYHSRSGKHEYQHTIVRKNKRWVNV